MFSREGSCSWLQFAGGRNNRDSDGYDLGYTSDEIGLYGGSQAEFA